MTDTTNPGWTLLAVAHDALRQSVRATPSDELGAATPCAQWNVAQVVQHAAGDQLAYAAALTGSAGPRDNPFAPSGQLAGSALELLEPALTAAATAFAGVAPGAAGVPNPLPQGPMAAELAVGACALDAAVHAWDIAVATGQDSPLGAELAAALLPVAVALVEPLRAYGAYAAALPAVDGDDSPAELLRYLGRDPEWSAGSRAAAM